jgi:lipoprotein NlpD
MQKTTWTHSCLSLFIVFSLFACTSTVKAPVDSRAKTPSSDKQASYSKSDTASSSSASGRDYHVVVKGDTLYSIAWRYGHDYRNVARWNDISANYVIFPGQFIRLKPDPNKAKSLQPGPIVSKKKGSVSSAKKTTSSTKAADKVRSKQSNGLSGKIIWRWPTKGKLVKLNTPSSKKGVDIAGLAGQKVNAAASGDVVYSGSGLLGYGKLIIIKHNDTFLSAYAHNEKLYAKEGDKVKAGQQIATMGLGNKGRPILHFEIRQDGTPVNPLRHLPKSNS